jgi:hypothetical protein
VRSLGLGFRWFEQGCRVRARLHEQDVHEDGDDCDRADRETDRVTGRPSQERKQEWDRRLAIVARSCAGTAVMTTACRYVAISNSSQQTHGFSCTPETLGRAPPEFARIVSEGT